MRINIVNSGSRGDIQPYIPLALGLQRAGHAVKLTVPNNYREWICSYGIEHAPMEGDVQEMMDGEQGLRFIESKSFATLRILAEMMEPVIERASRDTLESAQDSDLLIGAFGTYGVTYSIANKLGIPWMFGMLQPMHPTREFPSFGVADKVSAGAVGNYISHLMVEQAQWMSMRKIGNQVRREVLNMEPYSFWGPLAEARKQRIPAIYGYSPSVLPKPRDWGDHLHVTGYWFLDEHHWEPPADLVDFIESGPPPVYVGFGSMPTRHPEQLAQTALDALKMAGQRGVLVTGWGGLKAGDLPDTVFKVESAPHSWLFQRMAAVVHHGGAGTTGAGVRAGVPSIITPVFADQPWWGMRLYSLGVAPKPIPRKDLTAEQLADAIRIAVTDETMRERAAQLGERVRAEDGVGSAVRVINNLAL
jgi:UDP:flavonoid glycosyltransferase YjiC (YdhE family)